MDLLSDSIGVRKDPVWSNAAGRHTCAGRPGSLARTDRTLLAPTSQSPSGERRNATYGWVMDAESVTVAIGWVLLGVYGVAAVLCVRARRVAVLGALLARGLLVDDGETYRPTRAGYELNDEIGLALVE